MLFAWKSSSKEVAKDKTLHTGFCRILYHVVFEGTKIKDAPVRSFVDPRIPGFFWLVILCQIPEEAEGVLERTEVRHRAIAPRRGWWAEELRGNPQENSLGSHVLERFGEG